MNKEKKDCYDVICEIIVAVCAVLTVIIMVIK